MREKKHTYDKKWLSIIVLLVMIFIVSLILEMFMLNNVNNRNIKKTSQVLLDQVINVIKKNDKNEDELISSLKDDYMVRAKAVSYMLDKNEKAEYDIEELQKIAKLTSVDEIHLFDESGIIYSGTIPKYYGLSFDSGEQIGYFKPMLNDKKLTMCQDVTPNTSEGKEMMYAITWNETGKRMIQVGIKPVRLLEELKQNELSNVVGNMPMYEGISIYVANKESGKIYGATNSENVGKRLDDIGIPKKNVNLDHTYMDTISIDGKRYNCAFCKYGEYVVGVIFEKSTNAENNIFAMLIVAVYLCIAVGAILFMLSRVLKANKEKNEQLAILSSMAEVYYSMHLINLNDNKVITYTEKNEVKEIRNNYINADEMMNKVILTTVTDEYLDKALEFCDVKTVADRLTDKKIISGEFIGKNLGWFRASYISIENDENKRPVKVIFTTRSIDKEKKKEEKLIHNSNTDELTGCFNRRAYEKEISNINLDDFFVYISMDVNGLKVVNDTLGHAAGDELIKGAAECMKKTLGQYGKVYRIGGDEFATIIYIDKDRINDIKDEFNCVVSGWSGKIINSIKISQGYVTSEERNWKSIYDIAKVADTRMYEDKSSFYKKSGVDRHGQPAYTMICKTYTKILKINLTDDSYKIINMEAIENEDYYSDSAKISQWLHEFIGSGKIHPDDVEKYSKKTNIEYIREYFKEGNKILNIIYKRKINDVYRNVIMEIIPASDYSVEDQNCFLYVKKIEG